MLADDTEEWYSGRARRWSVEESRDVSRDRHVVVEYRTHVEVCTNGHHRLFVETLNGQVVEIFEGKTRGDVEHQLSVSIYLPIPPSTAEGLDILRTHRLHEDRLRRPKNLP